MPRRNMPRVARNFSIPDNSLYFSPVAFHGCKASYVAEQPCAVQRIYTIHKGDPSKENLELKTEVQRLKN